MRGKYVVTEGAVFHPEGSLGTCPLSELNKEGGAPEAEFRELERALKGDKTGWKRGLFDGGGQLLDCLFKPGTTEDLESVHSRLESFDKKGLELVHLIQEQATRAPDEA
ncbi:hypothetical protein OUZ56_003735 [Daphnia magna]|uniref:Uncharacterized protein n=1 Tax=Daphnia magna TaxID=35525 RepID=A0ABR0A9K9_9CRUS|nr:hypothetical protein OUZ56_003735 [Daphnia magna]